MCLHFSIVAFWDVCACASNFDPRPLVVQMMAYNNFCELHRYKSSTKILCGTEQ